MSELHASRKQLVDAASALSAAQLSWKAADDKWSIADIVEHVTATEPFLFNFYQQTAKTAADPAKKSPRTDMEVLKGVQNRDTKIQAPEPLKPAKVFPTTTAALAAFKERRDTTITFVHTTQDQGLRNKVVTYLEMDAYQMFLMIAGHTQRHVEQINEVKASPGFPGK